MIAPSLEGKDELGTSLKDMSSRPMKVTVHEYYSMSFRETGMLQLVMAEFRLARHLHGGRSKKTSCYKWRLFLEMRF